MFVINGRLKLRSSFADAAKRMESGLGPIAMRSPGFRGYYLVQTGERTGEGILVFDSASDYTTVEADTTAWFEKNMSSLCEGEPLVTTGEVIASLEPHEPMAQAGAQSGVETRPH